jgi:hypothetical protein
MGVYEGRGQLTKAFKALMLHWHETRMSWDDAQAKRFEENVLVPLQMDLRQAESAMDHMATLLHQAKHDCSETE